MTARLISPRSASLALPRYSTVGQVQRFRWPSEKSLTPTHCGNCRAALIASDIPTAESPLADVACLMCSVVACELIADAMPEPMTPERFRALPTEQGKRKATPGPKPKPVADRRSYGACVDCKAVIRAKHERCRGCQQRYIEENGQVARLVAALGDGTTRHVSEIGQMLGLTGGGVRKVIQRALDKGRPITRPSYGYYRLEVGS